jgi:hypothetical protein
VNITITLINQEEGIHENKNFGKHGTYPIYEVCMLVVSTTINELVKNIIPLQDIIKFIMLISVGLDHESHIIVTTCIVQSTLNY